MTISGMMEVERWICILSSDTAPKICTDDSCDGAHYAKGLCKNHYNDQLKRTGKLRKKNCVYAGCPRMTYSKYCSSHARRKKAGILDEPVAEYRYRAGCVQEGCEGKHHAKGYCEKHYRPPGGKKQNSADNNLRFKYGITVEDRDAIAAAQGGVCAICKEPPPDGKPLYVDHDHSHCGGPRSGCRHCVRGLLCNGCNRWMTKLMKHPELGLAVEAYLADPPAHKVIERERPKRGKPFAEERALLSELGLR